MPENSFVVDSYSVGKIRFETHGFRGEGDVDWPRLMVSTELGAQPREVTVPDQADPKDPKKNIRAHQHFTIIGLRARLLLGHTNLNSVISDYVSEPIAYESRDWLNQHQLEFPLDQHRIGRIEATRTSDAIFRIRFQLLLLKHPLVRAGTGAQGFDSFQVANCEMHAVIPKSQWVEQILPALGYGKYKVIEIPVPQSQIREPFLEAIKSFEKAQGYYADRDFEKAVAHCREVLELIPIKLKDGGDLPDRPRFNEKVRSAIKAQFGQKLTDSKIDYICEVVKAQWNLSSRSHHSGGSDKFDRHDADAVMTITAALMGYIGELAARQN